MSLRYCTPQLPLSRALVAEQGPLLESAKYALLLKKGKSFPHRIPRVSGLLLQQAVWAVVPAVLEP